MVIGKERSEGMDEVWLRVKADRRADIEVGM
jgi:hypothetical protein